MGKRLRALGITVVVFGTLVAAGIVLDHRWQGHVYACAGVGLNGPHASSADGALAAFVAAKGDSGADWKRFDHSDAGVNVPESVDYVPRHGATRGGYSHIIVSHRGTVWLADGACV